MSNGLAELRARKALQESGLPHDGPMIRADSTSNEVFITCNHVIRFNQQPNRRLEREAELCSHLDRQLPGRSWLPRVESYGGRPGSDYLIVTKRNGESLSRCWPMMSRESRRKAIGQVCAFLRDLHQTPALDQVPVIDKSPHLLGGQDPVGPLLCGLDQLAQLPHIDQGLVADAKMLTLEAADSVRADWRPGLIHGDLTLENVLWDWTEITAVIDLEWCRPAPADLELDILGRYFAMPEVHVSAEAERHQRSGDYAEVPSWIAEDYPELFQAQGLARRLIIYALAFEVRATIDSPPPADKQHLTRYHPYNRLARVVATGGHVTELLDHLGLASI
ncbi:MAG: aminoglycoside phosphotransferase family protein [Actinomycetota bacterium]